MKNLVLTFCLLAALCACTNTSKQGESVNLDDPDAIAANGLSAKSFLLTCDTLPTEIDLDMDISDLPMQELRLLRNYPYALHGMYFVEADLNAFFTSKCEWYMERCNAYLEAHDWTPLLDYDKTPLSKEEKAFVARIDKRIEELDKHRSIEVDGLKLANPLMTVNMFQLDDYDTKFFHMLTDHNFAIMPTGNQQLFNIYEENDYRLMPNYITTDVYLQATHMYFSYVLKSLESRVFAERLHTVYRHMYDQAVKAYNESLGDGNKELADLAAYCMAFFDVADWLLTGNDELKCTAEYATLVEREKSNIMKYEAALSPLMTGKVINFDYSLFRPRGHYARNEQSQRYFRSMMWIQTCTFCLEDELSFKRVAMMAAILHHPNKKAGRVGESMFKLLDFLIGEPDNMSVSAIVNFFDNHEPCSWKNLSDKQFMADLYKYTEKLFEGRNRIESKIPEVGCEKKINYVPARYTMDGEILSRMYDEHQNSDRPFPRGIDVFAALGVDAAANVADECYHDSELWDGYTKEAAKMKKHFEGYDEWNNSSYSKWMQCLVELQKPDKSYPDHMKTKAWSRHALNTALASWAELKHDAILYAEQPIVAECGGGGDYPDPVVVGYVEPNLKFWQTLRDMLETTKRNLEDNDVMNDDLREKTESLIEKVDFCIDITKKELAHKPLSEEDYRQIQYEGSSLEWFTLSVLDPDLIISSWDYVEGADRSVAVVADVFTRNVLGCNKCGILYEATGTADAMYVLVEIDGKVYLTRGATFSYYEFVNPLGQRLTDEEWQQRLEKGNAPGRPSWMLPYLLDKAPVIDEEVFYSTGC